MDNDVWEPCPIKVQGRWHVQQVSQYKTYTFEIKHGLARKYTFSKKDALIAQALNTPAGKKALYEALRDAFQCGLSTLVSGKRPLRKSLDH